MRIIIWLILGYLGYRIIKKFLADRGTSPHGKVSGIETFQDPVCGVYVAADDAVIGRMNEERIYFCSVGCLEKYQEQLQTKKH